MWAKFLDWKCVVFELNKKKFLLFLSRVFLFCDFSILSTHSHRSTFANVIYKISLTFVPNFKKRYWNVKSYWCLVYDQNYKDTQLKKNHYLHQFSGDRPWQVNISAGFIFRFIIGLYCIDIVTLFFVVGIW